MTYKSLSSCVDDLERSGQLRRITEEVDPYLEMAEIQRRVYAAQGPALLFTKVKGTTFPCVSNLFGTQKRTHFIFRDALDNVKALMNLKRDPFAWIKNPMKAVILPFTAFQALPKKSFSPPVLNSQTTIQNLPQIVSWPNDGGAYITFPQVYSEHPNQPGLRASNLGMYRVQLAGGQFIPGKEIGLHYQIHRGLGVHHHAAIQRGEKLKVTIFIGGPPAHTLAAVMPLPEGMPEVFFAGAMAGRGFRYAREQGHLLSADADFCITGTIDPSRTLPEGPFGDHLGYYSLAHPFPVMAVEKVYHRKDAIWPFTVVGRPPQEDSHLAELIHELASPILPTVIPGVHAVHAVEAAGVHPLLLAMGSERYEAYAKRKPQELLTLANAILGFGQLSLAKYLFIAAKEDAPTLDICDVKSFFQHCLERVDWRSDLHFQTSTTMDTLDYSGTGLNAGSKLVIAAAGEKKRELTRTIPVKLAENLPPGFGEMKMVMDGVAVITGPKNLNRDGSNKNEIYTFISHLENLCHGPDAEEALMLKSLPLIVIVDDAGFAAQNFDQFLWVTFTKSNPASDIEGVWSKTIDKHWGCQGPLVIDARTKPHHAPALESDPAVVKRVEAMAAKGRALAGLF